MPSKDIIMAGVTIADLDKKLDIHIASETDRAKKLDEVYKAVVTGNGEPSLRDAVRANARWISNANKFLWLLVGASVTSLVGAFGTLAYLVARIYPLLMQIEKLEPAARLTLGK
jgi:hypothetical protein